MKKFLILLLGHFLVANNNNALEMTTEKNFELFIDSQEMSTTNEPLSCEVENFILELSKENTLAIYWELSTEQFWLCNDKFINLNLTRLSCASDDDECLERIDRISYNETKVQFSTQLVACEEYEVSVNTGFDPPEIIHTEKIKANIEYDFVDLSIWQPEESKEVNLEWVYDKFPACPKSFDILIRGGGTNSEFRGIEGFIKTFDNLESCETYNFTIFPSGADEEIYGVTLIRTLNYTIPSAVRDLRTNYLAGSSSIPPSIEVSWTEPEEASKCVIGYLLEIKVNIDDRETSRNLTNPSFEIQNVFACANYTITVSPRSELLQSAGVAIEIRTPSRPFIKPSLVVENLTAISVTLAARVNNEGERNYCGIDEYLFICGDEETKSIFSSILIQSLKPFTDYNCRVYVKNEGDDETSDWSGESDTFTFTTKEGKPSKPVIDSQVDTTARSCSISWSPPITPNGKIVKYSVLIQFDKFLYYIPEDCEVSPPFVRENAMRGASLEKLQTEVILIGENSLSLTWELALPYTRYIFKVNTSNSEESSDFSEEVVCETLQEKSAKVKNFEIFRKDQEIGEKFNRTTSIKWSHPCTSNGKIEKFQIHASQYGSSTSFEIDQLYNAQNDFVIFTDKFEPDMTYDITIKPINTDRVEGDEERTRFYSKAGLPEIENSTAIANKVYSVPTTDTIKLTVPKSIFISNSGEITKLSFLITQADEECQVPEPSIGFVNNEKPYSNWLAASEFDCMPQFKAYDYTPPNSNRIGRSHSEESFDVLLGSETCTTNTFCNGPLRPGKYFKVTMRLYTSAGYADVDTWKIKMEKEVPFMLILILVLSVITSVFFIGLYISYRRTEEFRKKMAENIDNKDIGINDYRRFYDNISQNDQAKMKEEYASIQSFSESLEKTCIASRASERLNRYKDIPPFDENRVVLDADEFENDYINASFIRGYNDTLREYIATQGPLARTSHDFWRMVIQYRVEQIVMLTALVEGTKEKCHEYFPKFKGTVTFANIKITCIEETEEDHYIGRTLEIENQDVKRTVKHFYFKSWPDHGVPSTSEPLISFCKMLRKEKKIPDATTIVHCSAGVGRTGTFIATDIIIQKLKHEQKINVFDLVKKLREQRVKMVQSLDQYTFLYKMSMNLVDAVNHKNKWKVLNFFNQIIDGSEKPKTSLNTIDTALIPSDAEKSKETMQRE